MIVDAVNMKRETVRLILTDELEDGNNLCQDGAQECHRATAGCAVESSFWHPNALRGCCKFISHLISHLLCISKSKIGSERTPF
jgi:hypothetical protein